MGIISWIVFGLIAGGIARLIMPGKQPGGCVVTIILGIAGAAVGGLIGSALFGWDGATKWSLHSFLLAVGGALLLLVVYGLIFGRKKPD